MDSQRCPRRPGFGSNWPSDPPKQITAKKKYAGGHALAKSVRSSLGSGLTIAKAGSISSVIRENILIDQHHPIIQDGVETLWKQRLLCDVVIKVENNKQYKAHRLILASCSDYFFDFFTKDGAEFTKDREGRIEVAISGVSDDSVKSIIECLYTGKITLGEDNIKDILSAANRLKIFFIVGACEIFLVDRVDRNNCLHMLYLSSAFELQDLQNKSLKIASENFIELSETCDFNQLNVRHLTAILGRDDLLAVSELEVFYRGLRWLEYDRQSRLQYVFNVFRNIRLPLLSPSDIVDHVESVSFLINDPRCQDLVKEALHYHCLPARQSILQSTRTNPRGCIKQDCLLVIGGAPRLKSDLVNTSISYLDTDKGQWYLLTNMPGPRHHHAVAVLGGFLYVAGGEENNDQQSPLNTAYRYDPKTDAWLKIANMKHRRESFELGVLSGMLYAIGGRVDQRKSLASVERYNPSVDQWEPVAGLGSPRRSVAVATHNGRLYAIGGSGERRISSRVERYNPLLNKWESRRSLTTPRFFAKLAAVDTKLYLVGGATLDQSGTVTCVAEVECYTPSSDSWTTVKQLLEPRAEFGCAVVGEKIFIAGGYSWDKNVRLSSVEMYDFSKNTWVGSQSIDTPYTGIACCDLTLYMPVKGGQLEAMRQASKREAAKSGATLSSAESSDHSVEPSASAPVVNA
ncbi:kelch-like protein 31 [Lineus longissimus]|uniref:kelch-like protein 31 n=1 Tax=Lineus longissimus TaxID=88925 RepID=UPI00315CDA14